VTDLAGLMTAFVLGWATGVAYFRALWATVRALPGTRHPALVVFGSFFGRFGVAAAIFVLMVRTGGLLWIASALAGFVIARMVIVRRFLPSDRTAAQDAA